MMPKRMTTDTLRQLAVTRVVSAVGLSGEPTSIDIALAAPQICKIVSNAGDVFDLRVEDNTVTLVEEVQQ